MKKLAAIILFFLPVILNAQVITTIAGTRSSVFSGEGTPATSAGIPCPGGGTFDKHGNYYFADALNSHRIRKIGVDGTIITVAGNGFGGFSADSIPATNSRLYLPQAVRLDTVGNVYFQYYWKF